MKLIACCGLFCNECDAFIATALNDLEKKQVMADHWKKEAGMDIDPNAISCLGCNTKSDLRLSYCAECAIRVCCLSKSYDNCSQCADFSCEKTEAFYKMAPHAKKNIEELKK
jgi:hypothetical protein